MDKLKVLAISAVSVLAVIVMGVCGIQLPRNKAIGMEEAVYTAESDIKVQEKRRVDLVYNLADCVKQYDKHESETLTALADGMSKGNNIEEVDTALAAVTYAYPELKSNANYKQYMNELATTENKIAQYRENYNQYVKRYNRYVKGFPARVFLEWTGYEKQEFQRLDYQVSPDAPQDLFGE